MTFYMKPMIIISDKLPIMPDNLGAHLVGLSEIKYDQMSSCNIWRLGKQSRYLSDTSTFIYLFIYLFGKKPFKSV